MWTTFCIVCQLFLTVQLTAYVIQYYEDNRTPTNNVDSYSVCSGEECKTAAYVLSSLNLSVDPCVDFYDFTCGGWIHSNPVPPTQSHQNQFLLTEDKLYVRIKEIVENDDTTDPVPVRAASLYYRSCIDIERIESEGLLHLSKLLSEYGGWPMATADWNEKSFNWAHLTADSTRRWTVMSLLHIGVSADRLDTDYSVIVIDQPSVVLPRSMLADPDTYKIQLEAYRQWIAASAMLIASYNGQNISVDSFEKEARDVVTFEIKLAKLTSSAQMRRNAFRMYNKMTLRNLQEWTDSASNFKIDWLYILKTIFSETTLSFDYGEKIVVRELDFFFYLAKLLSETPMRTLANYLQWRLVRTISKENTNEMRNFISQFEQIFSGITQNEPRWKDCLSNVMDVLSFAVGYKYVEKYFNENSKNKALEIVENILSVFTTNLKNSEWMDESTKLAAIDKVSKMALFVGYPDWFSNASALSTYYDGVSVGSNHFENVEILRKFLYRKSLLKLRQKTDRTKWVSGPAVVNAFHDAHMNSIILPAGILQAPFFDPNRLAALNYGSIGAVIGHEILHGFDDSGKLSDGRGNLRQWWTEETSSMYGNKSQCFINQYNKYVVQYVGAKLFVNGITTQGENIADNSGLRQAFYAYQKHKQHKGPELEHPLAGLPQYNTDQLFFISYAMAWCESNTKESLLQEIVSDSHSPHKIRVTGTLSNLPEFSSTFKCPIGTPMNPPEKCTIW